MFGFSKESRLKRELLLFLDQQEEYVTSETIALSLQKGTSQTVRKVLNELSLTISSLYKQEQLNLQISTKYGIGLFRYGTNFQNIFEIIYTEELVYDVFRQLILNRSFLTEDFCKTHQISVSKLRRLISRINAFLKPYDCFIKIGKKVSIVGKESQIRLLFLCFYILCIKKLHVLSGLNQKNI